MRKRWDGSQRLISLKAKTKRDAQTKANRFLSILDESQQWDAAIADLRGKRIVRKGEDPDLKAMEAFYREYMAQAANPVKPATMKNNLQALGRLMRKCRVVTVSGIRQERIKFTNVNRRSLSSEIAGASSVFKASALKFYEKRGVRLFNPFKGIEMVSKKPDPYIPMSDEDRQKIWNECGKQDAHIEMITLLALGCGLRRNEIDKARMSWLTTQGGKPLLSVKREEDFIPKSRVNRSIPISKQLVKRLMRVRGRLQLSQEDLYLIPDSVSKATTLRLMRHYRKISLWLQEMGVTGQNRLHTLRKEFGSLVATSHGIFVASTYLGHSSVVVTQEHYGSLVGQPNVNIGSLIEGEPSIKDGPSSDLVEELAAAIDVDVKILRRKLNNLNCRLEEYTTDV